MIVVVVTRDLMTSQSLTGDVIVLPVRLRRVNVDWTGRQDSVYFTLLLVLFLITGGIARSATRRYLSYSEPIFMAALRSRCGHYMFAL